jgi:predicted DNA-binding transcriptional regulator AlpA
MSHTTKAAFTVPEFCQRHSLSRSKFYELLKDGLAPASFKLGRKRLIAVEAETEWRQKMTRTAA